MSRIRVALLGASGSIGLQAADVIAQHPDEFELVALASGRGGEQHGALASANPKARSLLAGSSDDLRSLVLDTAPDIALIATTGVVGLAATVAALEAGVAVAIANKETIVAGGDVVMRAARAAAERKGSDVLERLRPVDSEHSALWQCLAGESLDRVRSLWLTASGGPLRDATASEIAAALPATALKHPTWSMGAKITIDSATLVNKGLEAIEAHRLFSVPMEQVKILVHPQSVVHGLVEFVDGSTKAQMGSPDMRGPIGYALGYPVRMAASIPNVDLVSHESLTFAAPDLARFPGLAIALEAGRVGGAAPGTLIAADGVAVDRFLAGEFPLGGISRLLYDALSQFGSGTAPRNVAEVIALHEEVTSFAQRWNGAA
ncbi:MAG: 1-deoxy-D-xylulose-5-phosphate reductoisomerase [bacterium]|nr:1-deoxy-D-xylulose-5-phosphate reductoisomerase [Candidatus Aquidulcis frankliniae]